MKLLLVEDEIKLSEALTVLISRAGFTVDTALDGITALQKIRSDHMTSSSSTGCCHSSMVCRY